MRTTLTLDPDLDARLRELARERGVSFKQIVNETLRRGLGNVGQDEEPYDVPTRVLRQRAGVDLTKAGRLAATLEDEETARELERRR